MEKEKIKAEIVSSIKNAQTKLGFTLISEDWGGSKFQCTCALGCVLASKGLSIASTDSPNVAKIAEIFGVDEKWVESFMQGFDTTPPDDKYNKEAFSLGQSVRDEFKPVQSHYYYREWWKEQTRVAAGD